MTIEEKIKEIMKPPVVPNFIINNDSCDSFTYDYFIKIISSKFYSLVFDLDLTEIKKLFYRIGFTNNEGLSFIHPEIELDLEFNLNKKIYTLFNISFKMNSIAVKAAFNEDGKIRQINYVRSLKIKKDLYETRIEFKYNSDNTISYITYYYDDSRKLDFSNTSIFAIVEYPQSILGLDGQVLESFGIFDAIFFNPTKNKTYQIFKIIYEHFQGKEELLFSTTRLSYINFSSIFTKEEVDLIEMIYI